MKKEETMNVDGETLYIGDPEKYEILIYGTNDRKPDKDTKICPVLCDEISIAIKSGKPIILSFYDEGTDTIYFGIPDHTLKPGELPKSTPRNP